MTLQKMKYFLIFKIDTKIETLSVKMLNICHFNAVATFPDKASLNYNSILALLQLYAGNITLFS